MCSVLEFGKLSWPDILSLADRIKAADPEMRRQEQELQEYEQLLQIVKDTK